MAVLQSILGSRSTTIVLTLGLAAVLGAVVVAAAYTARSDGAAVAGEAGEPTSVLHGAYAFDPDDERQLVGEADNVFVGEVKKQTGEEKLKSSEPSGHGTPVTGYVVEVRESVKGNLGTGSAIAIKQTGGLDEEIGKDAFVEGDERLKPGKEYMFSINYDPEHRWNVVLAPPYGDVPIENAQEKAALKDKFEKAKKVSESTRVNPEAPVPAEWSDDGALNVKEPGGSHKH